MNKIIGAIILAGASYGAYWLYNQKRTAVVDSEISSKNQWWLGVTHFKPSEFCCSCCGDCPMDMTFILMLDRARSIAGVPFVITSGYRCPEHNAAVGGVPDSAHTKGYAADIAVNGDTKAIVYAAVRAAGFERIGVGSNFIHVDADPGKPVAEWTYENGTA